MGVKRFRLIQGFWEFPTGYIIYVDEHGWGKMGSLPWGWEIPYFVMKKNPEWFEEI